MRNRHRKHTELRFEVIPIIDLMFTLLIFFVIFTSTLAMQSINKGVNMKLPSAQTVATLPKATVVMINAQNQYFIDGNPIPASELRFQIQTLSRQISPFKVHLQADEAVAYGNIVHALDEIRLGGCFDISLQAHAKTSSPNPAIVQ
jgi:biopolymer transport protein ExbD